MKTIFDPKPLKIVIEGSHNGACFELDVFSRNQDWQINWLDTPEDYPGPGKTEERSLYDEQIYNAYKARRGEGNNEDTAAAILDDIQADLAAYQNEDGIGTMDDDQWQQTFVDRVTASITTWETKLHDGNYIVVETLGTPCIATDEDGETLIFDSRRAAAEYAEDIQEPVIVRI